MRSDRSQHRFFSRVAKIARLSLAAGMISFLGSSLVLSATVEKKPLPAPTENPAANEAGESYTPPPTDNSGQIPASEIPKASDPMAAPEGSAAETPKPESPDNFSGNDATNNMKPVVILRDPAKLPSPAARMRALILEAAKSGDVEKLRPLLGTGQTSTALSLGGFDGDPIAFLKSLSGDENGHEILAILIEVLESGFVQSDAATENEIFIWPYYYSMPLDALTPRQKVELFKLVTAGDYEDMKSFGAYIFYRVGITPEGVWQFFVAGD